MAGISLFTSGIGAAGFILLKFNDFAHAQKDLTEIKGDLKLLLQKHEDVDLRLTRQETKCVERHQRKRTKSV